MKNLIDKIYREKKMQRVSWNDLAENLPISGEALRVSFVRESVDENYLNEVCKKLKINTYNEKEDKKIETVEEPTTNYYYPDVNASAGLETEMQNDELKRVPINIPNWERGIDFINVYGDSMYPKFCSGEIIGIKEVEPQYINYGYAYVVIFNDGQVFLKYIYKGSDKEHWLLASENPKYESREYHLSLIKKIFIIKGVITKTTM